MRIIVDLFNQHSGDLERLKKMALIASMSGADEVKLQLINSQRVYGDNSRKYLEMTYEQVKGFFDFCKNNSIKALATAFDEEKLEWLDEIGVDTYKIASIMVKNDRNFCERILNRDKETIISLGFNDNEFPFGFNSNIKYLFCVSEYPTYLSNEKLKNMPKRFHSEGYTGFSDHSIGIVPAVKSCFLGAKLLEKHFTININLQNECEKAHLCSFNPESLRLFRSIVDELAILNKE